MSFENYFPLWNDLNTAQKTNFRSFNHTACKKERSFTTGKWIVPDYYWLNPGSFEPTYFQMKGREITLYRLFDMDMCLLSASCMMRSIQFEVTIEAEKILIFGSSLLRFTKSIMNESAPVANYTNELMATRFSDVMWLMEQIMWKSLDKRVASFLFRRNLYRRNK